MASIYDDILNRFSDPPPWSEEKDAALLEPFAYITSRPGKGIRGMMIEAFNKWLEVPEDKLQIIASVVSKLHSASLLIDDIEDDSPLRRGQPVAHKIYGVPQTINAANYVYFLACEELFALRSDDHSTSGSLNPVTGEERPSRQPPKYDLGPTVMAEILSLHRGQGLELLWRDSLQCPTEEEYLEMVNNKTGGLFRMAVKLMMAFSTTDTGVDYIPLVNLIAIYFQIRDDYINLTSEDYSIEKGFAEDLSEGKFSFPIIHGIRANTSNRIVMNVLQKRPSTPTLKVKTISYLKDDTKSFDYTLSILRNLEKQTRDEIHRFGGNPGLEAIMDALHID
jgi:geranylgeranyl diphosphate synthase type 3